MLKKKIHFICYDKSLEHLLLDDSIYRYFRSSKKRKESLDFVFLNDTITLDTSFDPILYKFFLINPYSIYLASHQNWNWEIHWISSIFLNKLIFIYFFFVCSLLFLYVYICQKKDSKKRNRKKSKLRIVIFDKDEWDSKPLLYYVDTRKECGKFLSCVED